MLIQDYTNLYFKSWLSGQKEVHWQSWNYECLVSNIMDIVFPPPHKSHPKTPEVLQQGLPCSFCDAGHVSHHQRVVVFLITIPTTIHPYENADPTLHFARGKNPHPHILLAAFSELFVWTVEVTPNLYCAEQWYDVKRHSQVVVFQMERLLERWRHRD